MGKKIALVGCGGVGTWVAQTLVLANKGQPGLVESITLIDHDTLEERNLARVNLARGYVGLTKVEAIAMTLRNQGVMFIQHPYKLDANNIDMSLAGIDTVICCSDDVDNQRLCKLWCQGKGATYQRAGYDGDTINVCRQLPLTFDEAAERADAGYHGVPEVYHAMLAGTLAAYSVLRQPVVVMGEVAKLSIKESTQVPEVIAEAIAEKGWQDRASDAGWHDSEDCDPQIPDGYHHYDDCNHEDCLYLGDTTTTIIDNLPNHVIEQIQEDYYDDAVTDYLTDASTDDIIVQLPKRVVDAIKASVREEEETTNDSESTESRAV